MAVKIHNTANLRRAQRWDEKDDAALCVLLKRKIRDINIALRESNSPYERSRLKSQKRHYKTMLIKVENGAYNGDIIFGELQAASALRSEQALRSAKLSTMAGGKSYVNSYQNMDFDYESAFRKKRYYGISLPIVLLLLSLVFVFIFIMGAFLPASLMTQADKSGIPLDSFFMYKIGKDTAITDIAIPNDGNWPSGVYPQKKTPKQGEPFKDAAGNIPETVLLNTDMGMTAVYISPFDIVKAWFRTPMLEKTRLDFLEDSQYFQGDSFYYRGFLSGDKRDALIIRKNADGNYDNSVIIRHIGTYGTIILLIVSFILGVVNIIINIVRIFTYTSKRLHFIPLLSFISSLLCMLCPALATIDGTEIGPALSSYFSSIADSAKFISNPETSVGIGLLFLVPVAINLIMLILPFLFRNVLKKRVTSVPRGNRRRNAINDPLYADEEALRRMR